MSSGSALREVNISDQAIHDKPSVLKLQKMIQTPIILCFKAIGVTMVIMGKGINAKNKTFTKIIKQSFNIQEVILGQNWDFEYSIIFSTF